MDAMRTHRKYIAQQKRNAELADAGLPPFVHKTRQQIAEGTAARRAMKAAQAASGAPTLTPVNAAIDAAVLDVDEDEGSLSGGDEHENPNNGMDDAQSDASAATDEAPGPDVEIVAVVNKTIATPSVAAEIDDATIGVAQLGLKATRKAPAKAKAKAPVQTDAEKAEKKSIAAKKAAATRAANKAAKEAAAAAAPVVDTTTTAKKTRPNPRSRFSTPATSTDAPAVTTASSATPASSSSTRVTRGAIKKGKKTTFADDEEQEEIDIEGVLSDAA